MSTTGGGGPWKPRGRRPGGSAGNERPAKPAWTRPRQPPAAPEGLRPDRRAEQRLHGVNAVKAVFARRPEAIRKLYLTEARIPDLQPLLKWCVANRVGYRVVEQDAELAKLASSGHHEGVVADVLRRPEPALADWLPQLAPGPQCLLWLDGVGNPHNLGAILRSSAHFGVAAVLLPADADLSLSGAAARVAEGGAEAVSLVRMGPSDSIDLLRSAGFALAATVVEGGQDLFATQLPERLVYVVGAEGEGMDRGLAAECDLALSIPGSGAVESLNVASATTVFLAAWARGSR